MNQYTIEDTPALVLNCLIPKLESIDNLLVIDTKKHRIFTDLLPAELENLTQIHIQQQAQDDYQLSCILF